MSNDNIKRRDKSFNQEKHREKFSEPTVCELCEASYVKGRWSWAEPEPNSNKVICPACDKIASDDSGGEIYITGIISDKLHQEILNRIHNVEECEKNEHPLERVISSQMQGDKIVVRTTGRHVAQRIARALFKAYKGKLSYVYDRSYEKVEIRWEVSSDV